MSYELSSALYGHQSDIRGLAITQDNYIVSCSRDKSAKLWRPNGFNSGYTEVQTYVGHKNFVTCVCAIPPSDIFPNGLIVTGGNDNIILLFQPECSTSFQQLSGHKNTVCKLVYGINTNILLSASWDKTVKLWHLSDQNSSCSLTIESHEAAVWAVLYTKQDFIITGSADKTIKIFQKDGSLIKTLTGHTDCVRDLAEIGNDEILSCSNDATIRKWNVNTGDCLDILYGHPNFIYSIYVREDFFVSSGEDRCLMLWSQGKYQTISLPAQSVWAVAVLSNNDVVTGSSDGVIRIFTVDEKRKADEETLLTFQNEVNALNMKSEQFIGGIRVSDLPGPETLEEEGTKEGQTKIVRVNGEIICYSWSLADKKWNKLGNVVGGSGGTQETSGKVLFEGKEYDFVFNVDIEDGKQPLKLPYNKTEDPWSVAQAFIHKHQLPQAYLEQVANFIINNSKRENVTVSSAPPEFTDPLTGSNRYIPEESMEINNGDGDPFTGSNRYLPNETNISNRQKNNFFPQTSYIRFDQGNLIQILDKLIAFNNNIEDAMLKFSEQELSNVSKLANLQNANYSAETIDVLKKLLSWPKNCLFPVLDILRLAVRNHTINATICSDKYIFGYLKDNLLPDSPIANQMLTMRTLCNMLCYDVGEKMVLNHKDFIIEALGSVSNISNKSLQIAYITLMLNMASAFYKSRDVESQSVLLLNLINTFPQLTEQESLFRALVTMGTILSQSNELQNCIDSSIKQLILSYCENGSEKVKECSKCVLSLIS
ncbi:hypothetical protein PGB90_010059 [Kerria lacca]